MSSHFISAWKMAITFSPQCDHFPLLKVSSEIVFLFLPLNSSFFLMYSAQWANIWRTIMSCNFGWTEWALMHMRCVKWHWSKQAEGVQKWKRESANGCLSGHMGMSTRRRSGMCGRTSHWNGHCCHFFQAQSVASILFMALPTPASRTNSAGMGSSSPVGISETDGHRPKYNTAARIIRLRYTRVLMVTTERIYFVLSTFQCKRSMLKRVCSWNCKFYTRCVWPWTTLPFQRCATAATLCSPSDNGSIFDDPRRSSTSTYVPGDRKEVTLSDKSRHGGQRAELRWLPIRYKVNCRWPLMPRDGFQLLLLRPFHIFDIMSYSNVWLLCFLGTVVTCQPASPAATPPAPLRT